VKHQRVTSNFPTGGTLHTENLDVLRTSRGQETGSIQGNTVLAGAAPHLCGLGAPAAQPDTGHPQRRRYRCGGTRHISIQQAANIMEAVSFAKAIGLPLVAHLTIDWAATEVGDDPDGKLFAKVREGLHKWFDRRGIELAGAWARECPGGDVEHCHLLFHLPMAYRSGHKLNQIEAAVYRLVDRHGGGVCGDDAIKLVIWSNPDGKYLIKGGGPKVWTRFRLRKEHRRLQGRIHGKRCGTTENIGARARRRALSFASDGEGA
jgi:hypothetical protein